MSEREEKLAKELLITDLVKAELAKGLIDVPAEVSALDTDEKVLAYAKVLAKDTRASVWTVADLAALCSVSTETYAALSKALDGVYTAKTLEVMASVSRTWVPENRSAHVPFSFYRVASGKMRSALKGEGGLTPEAVLGVVLKAETRDKVCSLLKIPNGGGGGGGGVKPAIAGVSNEDLAKMFATVKKAAKDGLKPGASTGWIDGPVASGLQVNIRRAVTVDAEPQGPAKNGNAVDALAAMQAQLAAMVAALAEG